LGVGKNELQSLKGEGGVDMAGDETDLRSYFIDYNATNSTVSSNYTWTFETPHVEAEGSIKTNASGIHPRLYFKYLKSKLNVLEQRTFETRMKKLEELADEFTRTGQEAMSDNCVRQFMVLSREAAIYACGFKKYITEEHVKKYKYNIRNCSLQETPLKNFGRVLPKLVAAVAKKCIEKKLFDDYVVFHLDSKAKKETEKERIERKRDPILFGKLEGSDKLYFLIDWEDELCDLRFSDIVENLALKGEDITLSKKLQFESKK
jgi:hypothetical protein